MCQGERAIPLLAICARERVCLFVSVAYLDVGLDVHFEKYLKHVLRSYFVIHGSGLSAYLVSLVCL